jgi:hypothetical protein
MPSFMQRVQGDPLSHCLEVSTSKVPVKIVCLLPLSFEVCNVGKPWKFLDAIVSNSVWLIFASLIFPVVGVGMIH